MTFDWWTFALQVVNFAILVWLLNRFLYKPVLRAIDARRAEADAALDQAAKREADAKAQLAAIEETRKGIAAERAAALDAAAKEADKIAAARRAEGERDAAALIDNARKAIASERTEALSELRGQALSLGLDVARKLLDELPPASRAEAWLEKIESYLAALKPEERDELRRGLANGAGLKVVTACALPATEEAEWRAQLASTFGGDVALTFETDPALIAGAELHFPTAVLQLSWRNALKELQTGMTGHDA